MENGERSGPFVIETPSVIPYEPRTAALVEARAAIRRGLASLSPHPGYLLNGIVEGGEAWGTDLDNALLYNIGGPQAVPTRHGVLLERHRGSGVGTVVVYSYDLVPSDKLSGRSGRQIAAFDQVPILRRPRSWQEIWAAIRQSERLVITGSATTGEVGIALTVGAPSFTGSSSGEFVKTLIDGVLTALHGHGDVSTLPSVAKRMEDRTGMSSADIADELFDRGAPLGMRRQLVVPRGSGVQCSPEDHRVGLIRINLDRSQPSWSLSGWVESLSEG